MTVESVVSDKRCCAAKRALYLKGLPYKRILILPIPSFRGGKIFGTDMAEGMIFGMLAGTDAVLGYEIPEYIARSLTEAGISVFDAARDEEFLQKNARLTALAALAEIITAKDFSPDEVKIAVVGYGRIGKALTSMLISLGVNPTVLTRRCEVREELSSLAIRADEPKGDILSSYDIVVNTSPAHLADIHLTERLHLSGVSLFELASGENFGASPLVQRLPGLPGKVYPVSCGEAYADVVR